MRIEELSKYIDKMERKESFNMEQQNIDYNEILLQAIDTLIQARQSGVGSDKTIICTITDNSDRANGHYKVTDGSTVFDAYSEQTYYNTQQQVYVNIPQNDWTLKKQITGRYIADSSRPLTYTPPLERIQAVTDNIAASYSTSASIAANGLELEKEIFNILNTDIKNSDTIVISANFKCLLNNTYQNIRTGSYGLKFTIIYDDGSTQIIKFDSHKDMLGDPYNFIIPVEQSQLFSLTANNTIRELKCSLYQTGNFSYGFKNTRIPYNNYDNIFVSDIGVYVGHNIENLQDNTVIIMPIGASNAQYTSTEYKNKTAQLIWLHKSEDGRQLIGFEDATEWAENAQTGIGINNDEVYYWIKWTVEDGYGNEKTISENGKETNISFDCNPGLANTKLRAYVYRNGVKYASDVLSYENLSVTANAANNLGVSLQMIHGKDSYDSYPWYDESGQLLDEADAYRKRALELQWSSSVELSADFWKGATITWSIPSGATMLLPVDKAKEEKDGYLYFTSIIESDINNYNKFNYMIRGQYDPNFINNTISCSIKLSEEQGGATLTTLKNFTFSSSGNSGTTYTLVVRPAENKIFGFIEDNTSANFEAFLYDSENVEIASSEKGQIRLSRVGGKQLNESYSSIEYNVIKSYIGQEWAGRHVVLETEYPVIFSRDGLYYSTVSSKIIYDSYGGLKSVSLPPLYLYELKTNKKLENITWELKCSHEDINATQRLQLSEENGQYTLNPPSIFMTFEDREPTYVLCAKDNDNNVLWSQPILLIQHKYGSEVLNNWDGQTIIDTENNRILTNAFAAGRMNQDNAFSGIVLGEIGKIDETTITDKRTGLIGYGEGSQAFGFFDNGTAFIGRSGGGRIEFDGQKGVIKSPSWQEKNGKWTIEENISGTLLDLDDAALLMQGVSHTTENGTEKTIQNYLKFNENGDGKLKLKLSSLDIALEDQQNQTLGGYIKASNEEIVSSLSGEIEKVDKKIDNLQLDSTYYYCISDTEKTQSTKQIKFVNDDLKPTSLIEGMTFNITFTNEHVSDTNGKVNLEFTDYNQTFEMTNLSWSDGESLTFTLREKNENLYLTLTSMTQEFVNSRITQSADEIVSEVSKFGVNFYGTSATTVQNNILAVTLTTPPSNEDYIYLEGTVLAVLMKIEASTAIKQLQIDSGSPIDISNTIVSDYWTSGDIIQFIYSSSANKWSIMDSGSHSQTSKIKQTADTIQAEVFDEDGNSRITQMAGEIQAKVEKEYGSDGSTAFGWSLTADGFYLSSSKGGTAINVFECDENGLTINGSGIFSGELAAATGTFEGSISVNNFFKVDKDNKTVLIGNEKEGSQYFKYQEDSEGKATITFTGDFSANALNTKFFEANSDSCRIGNWNFEEDDSGAQYMLFNSGTKSLAYQEFQQVYSEAAYTTSGWSQFQEYNSQSTIQWTAGSEIDTQYLQDGTYQYIYYGANSESDDIPGVICYDNTYTAFEYLYPDYGEEIILSPKTKKVVFQSISDSSEEPELLIYAMPRKTFIAPSGISATVNGSDRDDIVLYTNGNFAVDTYGRLYSNNATIEGTITANSGSIGGWNISPGGLGKIILGESGIWIDARPLSEDSSSAYYINCQNYKENETHKYFRVGKDGSIHATSGRIGGWEINSNYFGGGFEEDSEHTYYISRGGWNGWNPWESAIQGRDVDTLNSLYLTDNFIVTTEGKLYATGVVIDGKVTANDGQIGGWTLAPNKIGYWSGGDNKGSIFLSQAGEYAYIAAIGNDSKKCRLYLTQNFAVDTSGVLYANGAVISGTLTAQAGSQIGPLQINEDSIGVYGTGFTNTYITTTYTRTGKVYGSALIATSYGEAAYKADTAQCIYCPASSYANDGGVYAVSFGSSGIRVYAVTDGSTSIVKTIPWSQFFRVF